MRGVFRVLLFAVVGPLVGLLVMSVLVGIYTWVTTGSTRDFEFGPELLAPAVLFVAYLVGGVPALVTGIAAIFIARWRAGWAGWLVTALTGAAISFAGVLAMSAGPMPTGTDYDWRLVSLVTLTGAAAGLVCAMLFSGLAKLLGRRSA